LVLLVSCLRSHFEVWHQLEFWIFNLSSFLDFEDFGMGLNWEFWCSHAALATSTAVYTAAAAAIAAVATAAAIIVAAMAAAIVAAFAAAAAAAAVAATTTSAAAWSSWFSFGLCPGPPCRPGLRAGLFHSSLSPSGLLSAV
jgi:hypothetical protein